MKTIQLETYLSKKVLIVVSQICSIHEDSEGYSVIGINGDGCLVKIEFDELISRLEILGFEND